jgi:hypothetical protein
MRGNFYMVRAARYGRGFANPSFPYFLFPSLVFLVSNLRFLSLFLPSFQDRVI